MSNQQLFFAIVGVTTAQFGVLLALILHMSSRIDRLADKLDTINETLGRHDEAIKTLKQKVGGPDIKVVNS